MFAYSIVLFIFTIKFACALFSQREIMQAKQQKLCAVGCDAENTENEIKMEQKTNALLLPPVVKVVLQFLPARNIRSISR
jgi:hypothetical protein